jgi:hypothetical protein
MTGRSHVLLVRCRECPPCRRVAVAKDGLKLPGNLAKFQVVCRANPCEKADS